jgi:hypothetical protein
MKKASKKSAKAKLPRKAKASRTKATAKQTKPVVKTPQKQSSGGPYRGMYGVLFTDGSKDFIKRDELIKTVAKKVGKEERVVGYAYQVLRSPKHQSNKGRSTEVRQGELVKLVPVTKA